MGMNNEKCGVGRPQEKYKDILLALWLLDFSKFNNLSKSEVEAGG